MIEVRWKSLDFVKLPNLEISTTGVIRDKHTGKVLEQQRLADGGYRFWVPSGYLDGNNTYQYSHMVHRLVAQAFKPSQQGKYVIPKDGDYSNYDLDNLEWRI